MWHLGVRSGIDSENCPGKRSVSSRTACHKENSSENNCFVGDAAKKK